MATLLRGRGDSGGTERRAKSGSPAKAPRTTPALFVRQVMAELRKVIWPTRTELRTYTIVATVFVLVVTGIVTGLDSVIYWAVSKAFG